MDVSHVIDKEIVTQKGKVMDQHTPKREVTKEHFRGITLGVLEEQSPHDLHNFVFFVLYT